MPAIGGKPPELAGARATEARDAALAAEQNKNANRAGAAASGARAAADDAGRAAVAADTAATQAEGAAARSRAAAEARRGGIMAGNGPLGTGPIGGPLTADDEALLRAQCGDTCVQEYRDALALAGTDVLDWVRANGGQILLDLIGYTDAKKCFTEGDVEGCLWTAVNAIAIVLIVGKIPAVTAAVVRIAAGIGRFFDSVAASGRVLERLKKIITAGKVAKGELIIKGTQYSQSEREVAEWLVAAGKKVVLRDPVNINGVRTSDLVVNGVKYDVYTPITENAKSIISKTASKWRQVDGAVSSST